jgi:hypothetical protein
MIKDLAKLANELDGSGLHKEAERIDGMLKKLSGLYKSKAQGSTMDDNYSELHQWFDEKIFEKLPEKEIASDYLTKRYNLKIVNSPDDYIKEMEVQPWQEGKVRMAIEYNPPSATFRPEFLDAYNRGGQDSYEDEDTIKVTNNHKLAMLIADKDTSVNYKMSPDTFIKIKSGRPLTFADLTPEDFNHSTL